MRFPLIRKEFEKYESCITSDSSGRMLNSDSLEGISQLRNKAAVYCARIGQELAKVKDSIDKEFIVLTNNGMSASAASRAAEVHVNCNNEVSRRELQYLRDAMYNFSNSCASRINVLKGEKYD